MYDLFMIAKFFVFLHTLDDPSADALLRITLMEHIFN